MIFISHRGNLYGPDKKKENSIESITTALSLGLDVEVDVWFKNQQFYLGHDEPQYSISQEYLENPKMWCHAKNKEALFAFRNLDIHYFWHEQDSYAITSKGYIWSHVGIPISPYAVCVLPEQTNQSDFKDSLAICSDQILLYMDKI